MEAPRRQCFRSTPQNRALIGWLLPLPPYLLIHGFSPPHHLINLERTIRPTQRKLVWPLCKNDTHKSRSVPSLSHHLVPFFPHKSQGHVVVLAGSHPAPTAWLTGSSLVHPRMVCGAFVGTAPRASYCTTRASAGASRRFSRSLICSRFAWEMTRLTSGSPRLGKRRRASRTASASGTCSGSSPPARSCSSWLSFFFQTCDVWAYTQSANIFATCKSHTQYVADR